MKCVDKTTFSFNWRHYSSVASTLAAYLTREKGDRRLVFETGKQ
jgi:hypothetical protein